MVGDEPVTALRSDQAASCSMLLELLEAARGGFTQSTPFHEVVGETPLPLRLRGEAVEREREDA